MFRLRNNVSYIIYWTVLHQIDKAIKSREISIQTQKNKKLKFSVKGNTITKNLIIATIILNM